MKINLQKLFAVMLLVGGVVLPVWAQTNVATESGTNDSVHVMPVPQVAATASVATQESFPKKENPSEDAKDWRHPSVLIGLSSDLRQIVVSLAPFVMVLGIVAIIFYTKYRQHKMMNETLRAMIEKGLPLTPELVDSLKSRSPDKSQIGTGVRKRNSLRSGLILIGVGLGVVIVAGKPGWIVFFIGVAFLVCWLLEDKPRNDDGQPPKI